MNRRSALLVGIVATTALSACSSGGASSSSSPSVTAKVTIHGMVTHTFSECAQGAAATELDSVGLTIRDAHQTIIATGHADNMGNCVYHARLGDAVVSVPYSLSAPRTDFYVITVDNVAGTAGDLTNAEQCSKTTISYDDLKAQSFIVNLNSGATTFEPLKGMPGPICG